MSIGCFLGFHDWEIEYFGAGYPLRECRRCHRCEVRPIGWSRWSRVGEGTTLESTRQLHAHHDKQEQLSKQLRNNEITYSEYSEGMDNLLEEMKDMHVRAEG